MYPHTHNVAMQKMLDKYSHSFRNGIISSFFTAKREKRNQDAQKNSK